MKGRDEEVEDRGIERNPDEKGVNEIPDTGVCSGQVEGHFFYHNGREGKKR